MKIAKQHTNNKLNNVQITTITTYINNNTNNVDSELVKKGIVN